MGPRAWDDRSANSDRRESDRKKLIVEVSFEGGDATGIANTKDFSLGGLFLTTSAFFEIGQRLSLRLTVGGGPLILEGVIAYTEAGTGVGISFIELSEEKKLKLETEFDL